MADLIVCVTVDWEGLNLEEQNLKAMSGFRFAFPNIPLTHFICPAYFTRGGKTEKFATRIRGQIDQKQDEVGLHVHAWQSLVRAAVVTPRDGLSYWLDGYGPRVPYLDVFDPSIPPPPDSGHGVPLGAYSVDEIVSILQTAKDLLLRYGLTTSVTSFRCGGWLTSDPVFMALDKIGMRYESSATDAAFFAKHGEIISQLDNGIGLASWLASLWGAQGVEFPILLQNRLSRSAKPNGTDGTTQPYQIQIPASGMITEIPDNALLIDYLSAQEMSDRLKTASQKAKTAQNNQVLVCGFHQESADAYIGRLQAALEAIQKVANNLTFQTVTQVAESGLASPPPPQNQDRGVII